MDEKRIKDIQKSVAGARQEVRRQDGWRTIARSKEHGYGHLDGKHLPQSACFGLPCPIFNLAEPFQQLADVEVWEEINGCAV